MKSRVEGMPDYLNTEDKESFTNFASKYQEPKFVEFINDLAYLEFKVEINPKKTEDKYDHDLLINGYKGDLKTQHTPFYRAKDFYNLDPQWAITYNHKDYVRYKNNYTNKNLPFYIIFDVIRKNEFNQKYEIRTDAMRAIFMCDVRKLENLIETNQIPLHSYVNRQDDNKGNAKSSYVFDVRHLRMIYYEGRSLKLPIFQ